MPKVNYIEGEKPSKSDDTEDINVQTTNFYGKTKIHADGLTGALYEVKIDRIRGYTFVKIEIIPTKNKLRLEYWTSFYTKIKSGDYEAEFLGALGNDGESFYEIDCDDKWGWSNVKNWREVTLYISI
jgi:hypothetical protein